MKCVGTITNVRAGTIAPGKNNAGQAWQLLTIEGVRVFVPAALQNGWQQGQRVRIEVAHQGDKRLLDNAGKTVGYESQYELLTIEPVVAFPD